MNSEFFAALSLLEKEKGIPKDKMIERIHQALLAAIRKENPGAEENVFVDVDEARNKIDMYIKKTVVEAIENPAVELLPEEAKRYSKRAQIGDVVNVPIDTKKFGRMATQAAKGVIIQGIREAERSMVYEEFTSKEHEILSGTVTHIDPVRGSVSLSINSSADYTEAVLLAGERVPTEELKEGDKIKVYVVEVRKIGNGPQILISRTHPGLVKRLFELEVPEIYDGTVEIKSIAREAGSRTKMAVSSSDPAVEPIGACVGPKGGRVGAVVNELRGEKIDIVKYSDDPAEYIAAALAPSDVVSVTLLDEGKSCRVIVPDSQLSLAIGKEGQNVRLAARLTGYKIDIKPESEA
ncbi:MAG: transcription termination/antitermination protein NusA [Oscillospiraceae bacterium]|nr:transcription termination/antitermination protein NusA [Oscillospiraceae bacterium]